MYKHRNEKRWVDNKFDKNHFLFYKEIFFRFTFEKCEFKKKNANKTKTKRGKVSFIHSNAN